ncbi:MAG: hypothetical protein RIQ33_1710 [Bacteroidota bacterium]
MFTTRCVDIILTTGALKEVFSPDLINISQLSQHKTNPKPL